MNVLGLHSYSHEAGACIVCGGGIFAVSQERLSRKKYDGAFPADAIEYVMGLAGIKSPDDVDIIVCDALAGSVPRTRRALKRMGFRAELHPVAHHDAHAASAYFTGPFEEAVVIVADGCGSFAREIPGIAQTAPHRMSRELQSAYSGTGGKLTILKKTFSAPGWAAGPGAMYGLGAMMCGFGDLGAGKLMALAALGERDVIFPDCAFTEIDGMPVAPGDPGKDPLNPEHLELYSRMFFGGVKPRKEGEPIIQAHAEIARAVQRRTSEAVLRMASRIHSLHKGGNLCVAGGYGLNCPTNSAFLSRTPFKNVYIQPAATDAGIPLGAALYGYHIIGGQKFVPFEFSPFTGRRYTGAEAAAALSACGGLKTRKPRNLAAAAAEMLASGMICGWFHGRSEYGPRALGARSILADPRAMAMKARLDTTVKLRESFRPYAPVILEERAGDWFKFKGKSPHMLLLAEAKPRAMKLMPAVVHCDKTARLQTVSKKDNPQLYALLLEFEKLTGIPALLNTSFNRRGEPIVETPADAVECFMKTGIDFLAIEGHIATKNPSAK